MCTGQTLELHNWVYNVCVVLLVALLGHVLSSLSVVSLPWQSYTSIKPRPCLMNSRHSAADPLVRVVDARGFMV